MAGHSKSWDILRGELCSFAMEQGACCYHMAQSFANFALHQARLLEEAWPPEYFLCHFASWVPWEWADWLDAVPLSRAYLHDVRGAVRQQQMVQRLRACGIEVVTGNRPLPMPPKMPFYQAMDECIRPVVYALRNEGINTTASCGHEGYILFDLYRGDEAVQVEALLSDLGIRGFSIQVWITDRGRHGTIRLK